MSGGLKRPLQHGEIRMTSQKRRVRDDVCFMYYSAPVLGTDYLSGNVYVCRLYKMIIIQQNSVKNVNIIKKLLDMTEVSLRFF